MYKAILFSFDGGYVTDHKADTIQGVWDKIADQGSRWFFYPFSFVIKDLPGGTLHTQRIVDAPDFPYLDALKGLNIRNAGKSIADNADVLEEILNA